MKICYAISGKFAQQAQVSLLSAFENNDCTILDGAVIAGSSLSDDDVEGFSTICNRYNRSINVIDADVVFGELYKEMDLKGYGGYIAPWMFVCPNLIAQYCNDDRILMVDADTLVVNSLKGLKELDMTGKAMAAVIAVNNYRKRFVNPELRTLTNNKRYYNCGVVLFNLAEWNKNDCWDKIYTTCLEYHPIDVVEQTLINNSIPETLIYTLGPEYNYWGHKYKNRNKLIYELSKGDWYSASSIDSAHEAPIIIHYKDWYCHPWHKDAVTTLADEYTKYYSILKCGKVLERKSSIFSEISNNSKYLLLKKTFFLNIERCESLTITKIADWFVETCQILKNALRMVKKERN